MHEQHQAICHNLFRNKARLISSEYKKNRAQSVARFFPVHFQGVLWVLTTKRRLRLCLGKVNYCCLKDLFTSPRSAEATTARQACNVVACLGRLQTCKCERTRLWAGLSLPRRRSWT